MVNKSSAYEDDKSVSSFIGKLSMMLQDPSAQPFVCWSPSGESIIIVDPPRFSSQILPRYFKHSNFASFVRQLNLYGFHKTSQESDTCEFSHPVFRQGNEHIFKDIRRKVSAQGFDRESTKSRSDMERMMQTIEELKSRQQDFEKALEQKEAEKMLIYQEMMQSKHRQDVLEARMSRMVGVLMQACQSIGLTQIEGDGGSNLLQILDGDGADGTRGTKRQRLIENSPNNAGEKALLGSFDGTFKFQSGADMCFSDAAAGDILDALSARISSVSGTRDRLLAAAGLRTAAGSKPILEDVTDSLSVDSSFLSGAAELLGSIGGAGSRSPMMMIADAVRSPSPAPGRSDRASDPSAAAAAAAAADFFGAGEAAAADPTAAGAAMGLSSPLRGPMCPDHHAASVASAAAAAAGEEHLGGGTVMLSPRGFDALDGLPTESLNSIELNLGSQCFTLDSLLSVEGAAAGKKEEVPV